jgi:hypothetical protein
MLMSLLIGHICQTHGVCWEHTQHLFVCSVPFDVLCIHRNVHMVTQNAKSPNFVDDRWCCGVPSWRRLFNWFCSILLVESCYLSTCCPYPVFYCQFLTLSWFFNFFQETYLEYDRLIILFNFKPSQWMFTLCFMQTYVVWTKSLGTEFLICRCGTTLGFYGSSLSRGKPYESSLQVRSLSSVYVFFCSSICEHIFFAPSKWSEVF